MPIKKFNKNAHRTISPESFYYYKNGVSHGCVIFAPISGENSLNFASVAESVVSEWLKFKLTSEKEAEWCYVNLHMETVAMENKQQRERATKETAKSVIHFGLIKSYIL